MSKLLGIQTTGVRGQVKGKPFSARPGPKGYVLHSEYLAAKTGKPLRYKANVLNVSSLEEVAHLMKIGGFHLRLWNQEHKQFNLRNSASLQYVYSK